MDWWKNNQWDYLFFKHDLLIKVWIQYFWKYWVILNSISLTRRGFASLHVPNSNLWVHWAAIGSDTRISLIWIQSQLFQFSCARYKYISSGMKIVNLHGYSVSYVASQHRFFFMISLLLPNVEFFTFSSLENMNILII